MIKENCVIYSADSNFADVLAVSLSSLLKTNANICEFDVIVVQNDISKEKIAMLDSIAFQYKKQITYFDANVICEGVEISNTFPISAYCRLFIYSKLEYKRAVYLDCDTLVCGSLLPLFTATLKGFYVAGVQDTAGKKFREGVKFEPEDRYINSGVLAFDVETWKEDQLNAKFIGVIKKFNGNVPHFDQGVVNAACYGKIKILPPQYNAMPPIFVMKSKKIQQYSDMENYYTQTECDVAINNPEIIHFTQSFFNRPWLYGCSHPFRFQYAEYMDDLQIKIQPSKKIPIKLKLKWLAIRYMPIKILKMLQRR